MSKHTPGPWASDPDALFKIRAPELDMAITYLAPENTEPNAQLIAEAPAMLEALQLVTDCLSKCLTGGEVSAALAGRAMVRAGETIARATGVTDNG